MHWLDILCLPCLLCFLWSLVPPFPFQLHFVWFTLSILISLSTWSLCFMASRIAFTSVVVLFCLLFLWVLLIYFTHLSVALSLYLISWISSLGSSYQTVLSNFFESIELDSGWQRWALPSFSLWLRPPSLLPCGSYCTSPGTITSLLSVHPSEDHCGPLQQSDSLWLSEHLHTWRLRKFGGCWHSPSLPHFIGLVAVFWPLTKLACIFSFHSFNWFQQVLREESVV